MHPHVPTSDQQPGGGPEHPERDRDDQPDLLRREVEVVPRRHRDIDHAGHYQTNG
jgi:hypothetical protein